MKKKILILASALAIITCIGSNRLMANAMTLEQFAEIMDTPVAQIKSDPMLMELYYYGYHDDSLGTYEEFMTSLNETSDNDNMDITSNMTPAPAPTSFDYNRYATENPDVAAVFGLNEDALYNHYTICGAKEGRKAYYTDGTIIAAPGVAVLRTEMLDLVNADRLASNPEAAPLAWSEELANYGLTRVVEVSNNFQSPEYLDAYNNGAHADEARIVHSGSVYKENVLLNWSANTAEDANSRWIESEGHHRVRVRETYTQYAAVSYIDPVTGEEAWIELFQ